MPVNKRKILMIPISGEPFSLKSGKHSQEQVCTVADILQSPHWQIITMRTSSTDHELFGEFWPIILSYFRSQCDSTQRIFVFKILILASKDYFLHWIIANFLPRRAHISRLLIIWLIFMARILDNYLSFFRHNLIKISSLLEELFKTFTVENALKLF